MEDLGAIHPAWHDTIATERRARPPLKGDVTADVVVIGAGITGVTTAWYLINAGLSVVMLEAEQIGSGTTGSSTGNLYVPVGPRLHAIHRKHGHKVAQAVAAARSGAIDFVEARVNELDIDCDFERVPFHLFSSPDDEATDEVRKEYEAARQLGLPAIDLVPDGFPFRVSDMTTLADQAQFNPLRYVVALCDAVEQRGCRIHEHTRVAEASDGEPCKVMTSGGTVTARYIVKATHVPQGFYAVHAAMIPHREYAVLARIDDAALLSGIYWNANKAWRYSVRPFQSDDGNSVLVIGEPHKPGEQTRDQLARIQRFMMNHFKVARVTHTWAAQNYQSADLLPYIGTSPLEKHTWMATGFAGDGLVWGTVAGKLISDCMRGVENAYAETFDPKRFTPVASATNFVKETAAVSKHLLHDLTTYGRSKECGELVPGSGCVMKVEGEHVAACRDRAGRLHVVSAVCTHMGCLVHWNSLEQSWDCPCHGSRFSMEGRVLEGPALQDLATVSGVSPT